MEQEHIWRLGEFLGKAFVMKKQRRKGERTKEAFLIWMFDPTNFSHNKQIKTQKNNFLVD